MLASTVQFSTYDQTPPNRPRRPTPSAETWRYKNRRALTRDETVARSLRTQQRAYNRFPTTTRVPHPNLRRDHGPY